MKMCVCFFFHFTSDGKYSSDTLTEQVAQFYRILLRELHVTVCRVSLGRCILMLVNVNECNKFGEMLLMP